MWHCSFDEPDPPVCGATGAARLTPVHESFGNGSSAESGTAGGARQTLEGPGLVILCLQLLHLAALSAFLLPGLVLKRTRKAPAEWVALKGCFLIALVLNHAAVGTAPQVDANMVIPLRARPACRSL